MASDNSPINDMCEVTGDRSYVVTSNRVLHQCIESLVQKLQSGVVIHFEKFGSDPPLLEMEEPEVKELDSSVGVKFGGMAPAPGSRPHTPNSGGGGGSLAAKNTAWHSQRKMIYVQRSAQKGRPDYGECCKLWCLPLSLIPILQDVGHYRKPSGRM